MTLIVGTVHWKGICFTSDTRATRQTVTGDMTYEDDAQKVSIITGGFGIAASGNALVNSIFKAVLRSKIEEDMLTLKNTVASTDSHRQVFIYSVIKNSLVEVSELPRIKALKEKAGIRGFIGGVDPRLPLTLGPEECKSVVEIFINSPQLNSIYKKYHEEILSCSNGTRTTVVFKELPFGFLYGYSLEIKKKRLVLNLDRIPFGTLAAFGSGSEFAYESIAPRILGWVLMNQEPEDIHQAVSHLTQIHSYADKEVLATPGFDFKTFGGGIVPAVLHDREGMASMEIPLAKYFDKEHKLITEIFQKDGKLYIKTPKLEDHILRPFTEINGKDMVLL